MNTLEISSINVQALGGEVTIQAEGPEAETATNRARKVILEVQRRLSRFDHDSELSRVNRDPRRVVPASNLMLRFVEAVHRAGVLSDGLVDAGMLEQVEAAGYTESIDPDGLLPLIRRSPGVASSPSVRGWLDVSADFGSETLTRPVGLRLDSGGIGKGLAADLAARTLAGYESWAVVCGGDLRFGGDAGAERPVRVSSPSGDAGIIATMWASRGAVATSGTTRRSWQNGSGRAHHLIDPRTGLPADTGVIQATAVAPDAVEAETRAKAALLAGPEAAFEWLPYGGVVVTSGGRVITDRFQREAP